MIVSPLISWTMCQLSSASLPLVLHLLRSVAFFRSSPIPRSKRSALRCAGSGSHALRGGSPGFPSMAFCALPLSLALSCRSTILRLSAISSAFLRRCSMAGKTNVFAFVYFTESISDAEMFERLESQHFQAVVSPLHDADVWTRSDVAKRIYRKADQVKVDTGSNRGCYYLLPLSGESDVLRPGDLEHLAVLPCYLYWAHFSRDSAKRPDEERWDFWRCPRVGDKKKPHRHVMIRLDYSTTWETVANKLKFSHSRISYMEPVSSREAMLRYFCHLDSPDKTLYPRASVIQFGGFNTDALFKSDELQKDGDWSYAYKVIRTTPSIQNVKQLCDALIGLGEDHLARVVFGQSAQWNGIIRDTRLQRRELERDLIDPMTGEVVS